MPFREETSQNLGGTELGAMNGKKNAVNNPLNLRSRPPPPPSKPTHEEDVEEGNSRESRPTIDEKEDMFHIRSVGSSHIGESIMLSSIRDVIIRNHHFYWFSCVTGIIIPGPDDQVTMTNTSNGTCCGRNCRLRVWRTVIHCCLIISTLIFLIFGIVFAADPNLDPSSLAIIVCDYFGIVFQNLMLYAAIGYLRKEIDLKRDDVNRLIYEEAFQYAIGAGRKLCALLFGLLLLLVIVQLATASGIPAGGEAYIVILEIITYSPSNLMLSGLFTFLVMEQRITYFTMEAVKTRMEAKTLTDVQYLQAKESISTRERVTPINWLVSAAVVGTLFGIIFIFLLSRFELSAVEMFSALVTVFTTFGRQTIALILFLLEIAAVNEVHEVMVHHLTTTRWIGEDTKRLNLYVVLKEMPLGSSIFFYRPSRTELLLQIASSIIGVAFAVFWAVVFA